MNGDLKSIFETLAAWKEGRKLRIEISQLVKEFPKSEEYRLKDQMIRSSRSITANIAEGYGRYHFKENIQFCRQSRGSVYELLEHLYVALDEQYITEEKFNYFRNKINDLIKIINGYISYLKNKSNQKSTELTDSRYSPHSPHSPHSTHSPKKNGGKK
jgi:four helix bundle protein